MLTEAHCFSPVEMHHPKWDACGFGIISANHALARCTFCVLQVKSRAKKRATRKLSPLPDFGGMSGHVEHIGEGESRGFSASSVPPLPLEAFEKEHGRVSMKETPWTTLKVDGSVSLLPRSLTTFGRTYQQRTSGHPCFMKYARGKDYPTESTITSMMCQI